MSAALSKNAAAIAKDETLLVLSDVHLGSDLDDYAERASLPDASGETKLEERSARRRSRRIDADLVALLRHYRGADKRWRLVIAGDFIDFLGMAIAADTAGISTTPSEEEMAHGLGNAEDHARIKLQRVCVRHSDVFDELAAFVADGHSLTLVHGNHDLEFHWPAVQTELKAQLYARTKAAGSGETDDVYSARIEFAQWFFYRDGVAYIEHGHQYDRFCATDHVMAPLSPRDPRRIARGFCDVLLRFVVRPTRGMSEHGHESKGMLDYVAFARKLGFGGMRRLGMRFVRAVLELFRLRSAHFNDAAVLLRAEHEKRMAALAAATRIGMDRLRALSALQTPPITRSIRGILASVFLDKLALAMGAATTLLISAVVFGLRGRFAMAAGMVALAWFLAERYLARDRQLDPSDQMIDRATKLAKLFPAAFVVMGHTHVPVEMPVGSSEAPTTYINVGSWAEEEADPEPGVARGSGGGETVEPAAPALAYRAARTHLIIHPRGSESDATGHDPHDGSVASASASAHAEFLTWDPDHGPKRYTTG